MEYLSGRRRLEVIYNEILDRNPEKDEIWKILVEELKVELDYDPKKIEAIPKKGPLIIVANHPFGVVDGLVLGHLVSQVRSEFKFLVNEVLCREEVLNHFLLPIDFEESKAALNTNIQTRKIALERLANDEAIVIFPAGGVATAPKIWKKAEDLEWKRFVVKLIRKSNATVVPFFFHGENSFLFQIISNMSMDLRLGILLNEVRNKMGKSIKIGIGNPISFKEISALSSKEEILPYLREQVFKLKNI